jgi:ketosteroid isomerase-like protein
MGIATSAFVFLVVVLANTPAGQTDSHAGLYTAPESILELHWAPDGKSLRGYLRSGGRVAALAPVEIREGAFRATATQDDGTREELTGTPATGPVITIGGRKYQRAAVEQPADAKTRREIQDAYLALSKAVSSRDFDAFQALRVPEFATISPNGVPSPGSRMADRARGMLERIQPPITTTNDIIALTVRGDDAIATVRQKFTRMQMTEGQLREIHTEVTQRETWTRTPQGWKLSFVDEVRDQLRREVSPAAQPR